MVSGVHGSAWTAVVKDTVVLPGGFSSASICPSISMAARPDVQRDPGRRNQVSSPCQPGENMSWFDSTRPAHRSRLLHVAAQFGAVFTARDGSVFRKNAIVMPLYQLILLFVFFVGFAAVLKVPGLKGGESISRYSSMSIQAFALVRWCDWRRRAF